MTPTQRRKNSEIRKSLKLKEIAALVDGEILGDAGITITGVAGIKEAKEGDIALLSDTKYQPFLHRTQASAVITAKDVHSDVKPLVRTKNPLEAFNKIVSVFLPSGVYDYPGIHKTVIIGKDTSLGKDLSIGPHVVIERGVCVGDNTCIGANTYVGADSSVGSHVRIYPNVTIRERTQIGNRVIIHSGTVIGSDGFGYDTVDGTHIKIPQIGWVLIEDDVEIGANVCIDRGRFQKTWIQKGTKIDNLVQIAHNVVVGPNCLIVSQAGISGSVQLGKNVVIAGQAGIVGHLALGDRTVVGAQSGVTKSTEPGSIILGGPAKPIAEQKRIYALIAKLPEIFKDLSELKKKIGAKNP